jgi:hypothetical protein
VIPVDSTLSSVCRSEATTCPFPCFQLFFLLTRSYISHLAPYVPSSLRNHLPLLPAKFLISTTTLVSRFLVPTTLALLHVKI